MYCCIYLLHWSPTTHVLHTHTKKIILFVLHILRKRYDKRCTSLVLPATPSTVSCYQRVGSSRPPTLSYMQACLFFFLFLGCSFLSRSVRRAMQKPIWTACKVTCFVFDTFKQPTCNELWRLLRWGTGIKLHWPNEASLSMYGTHSRLRVHKT